MGAAQHNADIQYKESFITECSITNNVIDTGKNAVLNHEVEVLVSDQVPSNSPDEKAAYVRLILMETIRRRENRKPAVNTTW